MIEGTGCTACRDGTEPPFPFVMAFQPIVDAERRRVFAFEALIRGPQGEGAGQVLARVSAENRYAFDQSCRVAAIRTAADLAAGGAAPLLSINILPNAVYEPETCLQTSIRAAREVGYPIDRIMFEMTEQEQVADLEKLKEIIAVYRDQGFTTAIDDFGAGHSGLNLLADFHPDLIKLDMALTRGIDRDAKRQTIVGGIVGIARQLDITVVAEGIETVDELAALRQAGIELFQGFLFARPALQAFPEVAWPHTEADG